jgi:hypothetical protein
MRFLHLQQAEREHLYTHAERDEVYTHAASTEGPPIHTRTLSRKSRAHVQTFLYTHTDTNTEPVTSAMHAE